MQDMSVTCLASEGNLLCNGFDRCSLQVSKSRAVVLTLRYAEIDGRSAAAGGGGEGNWGELLQLKPVNVKVAVR